MSREKKINTVIGRGGGGHGGGGHGGGRGGPGRIHGGIPTYGAGPRWRGGPWLDDGPWVYEVPSHGVEIDDLIDSSKAEQGMAKDVAKEVVRQLGKSRVVVGDDLDCLEAELIGEDKEASSGAGKGASSGGLFGDFGLGTIFQTAGNLAQAGVSIYESEKSKEKSAAEQAKALAEQLQKLNQAIIADATASQASARATFSAQNKLPSAAVDASAASQAAAAQVRAGGGLSPESVDKRFQAANNALSSATAKAQANPKDAYALALMNAWQATLNKIQNAQITSGSGDGKGGAGAGGAGGNRGGAGKSDSGDSWFERLLHWLHLK